MSVMVQPGCRCFGCRCVSAEGAGGGVVASLRCSFGQQRFEQFMVISSYAAPPEKFEV